MNDRFKFRVFIKNYKYFDEDAKKYKIKPFLCDVHSLHLGTNKVIVSTRFGNVSWFLDDNAILEQCTGLKDKNGKLIFEGDIIRYKQCGELKQSVVYFSEDFNCFTIGISCGSSTKRHALRIPKGCEIIGNIHDKGATK